MVRRILVGTLTSFVLVAALRAECVMLPAKEALAQPSIELIFGGTVANIEDVGEAGSRVTIDVQRVWKGPVPTRIELYSYRFAPERPQFKTGTYTVVLGTRLSDETRKLWRLPKNIAPGDYQARGCTDALERNFEANLGASHPPKH